MARATRKIVLLYNKTNIVYSTWVIGKLFIWLRSEKNWSEKSCLSGLGQRKFVYSAWFGFKLFIRPS